MSGESDAEALQLLGAYVFGKEVKQSRLDEGVVRDFEFEPRGPTAGDHEALGSSDDRRTRGNR